MVWKPGIDYSWREHTRVWHLAVPYTRGRVLDIGGGLNRIFEHWTYLNSDKAHGGQRVADIRADGGDLSMFADKSWDAVFSSHTLEHIKDHVGALVEWARIVKDGGHICLYLPHADLYPNIGQPGANPDHVHDFRPEDILRAMEEVTKRTGRGWECLECEVRGQDEEYCFWMVFRLRAEPKTEFRPWQKPEKAVMVIRLGAYGDQIQAASILPHLKAQGYHVTYMSAEPGVQAVLHDPHIDDFLIVDKDQIPNLLLGEYFERMGKERFDRVVNLCESIEGALLQLPGRVGDTYPHEVRRKLFDVNYLERTHDIAGVPHEFHARFYPTDTEMAQTQRQMLDRIKEPVTILWVIAGSSPHKLYPWQPQAIVQLLAARPDVHVILAGDERCQAIEDLIEQAAIGYFGSAARITRTSGNWPVRATMTLARMVDVVVGPETGVLNAVCLEERPAKVVLLSHSTRNMLVKHWVSTLALETPPDRLECSGCARLHYDASRCRTDAATGAAACQAMISPKDVAEAVIASLPEWEVADAA
jgi:ADP-heptose:LPS heptosyltransferase/predicted SAM-dependent methyltransferase